MNLIQEAATDFEMMYDGWKEQPLTQRAKVIAKVFVEGEFLELAKHRIAARKANERAKKVEAEMRKQKREEQKRRHWEKWSKIISKAEQYYGDIVYEYCGGSGGGSEEEEEVFAKIERGEFDEEVCMREALFTAFGGQVDDPDFYDKAIKFWERRWK